MECHPQPKGWRRELLAEAANRFLDELLEGKAASPPPKPGQTTVVSGLDEAPLRDLVAWCTAHGVPQPQMHYEVCDTVTGAVLAEVDAAWPQGIQEEYSAPVALLLERDEATEAALNTAGYRFFTSADPLYHYLRAAHNGSSDAMAEDSGSGRQRGERYS